MRRWLAAGLVVFVAFLGWRGLQGPAKAGRLDLPTSSAVGGVGPWEVVGNGSGTGLGGDGGHVVTLRAHRLVLMNAANHRQTSVNAPANITVDMNVASGLGTNNSIPGGRDRANTFEPNGWVYAYWVRHGALGTLSGVLSLDNPSVGPNLPDGYTSWALGGIFKRRGTDTGESNANGNLGGLLGAHAVGSEMLYAAHINVLYRATSDHDPGTVAWTTADMSQFVNQHAATARLGLLFRLSAAGGNFSASGDVIEGSGHLSTSGLGDKASASAECLVVAGGTSAGCSAATEVVIPNISSRVYYSHVATTSNATKRASTGDVSVNVRGFSLPGLNR